MAAERTLTIVNKLGLHARAAAKLVQTAAKFKSEVKIARIDAGSPNSSEVNAKSIMGVLMLAAAKGTTVKLWASGEDEEAAVTALVQLIEAKFGEE
jgi:phosphocarrier protein